MSMVINGFFFDQRVQQIIQDLKQRGCQTAADFQQVLKILYPAYRQINSEQDFRDFVAAAVEFEEEDE